MKKTDNRVKLSPEQKQEIITKVKNGATMYRTAKDYGVSAVCVYYLLNPEKQEENAKKANRSTPEYMEANRNRVKAFKERKKQTK